MSASGISLHSQPVEAAAPTTAKVYVIILCGAGDRPIERLGGRTPLDVARTPNLDRLAAGGVLGRLTVIDGEITPESDSGAMALLGYDPWTYYTGRGPLEGLGMGFWPDRGSAVAFRINFASEDRSSGRLDRRTARDLTDPELQALADEVRAGVTLAQCPGIEFEMTAFGRHRGILCFTSTEVELSGNVSNTDPGFRKVGPFGVPRREHRTEPDPCSALDDTLAAEACAAAVNAFVAESRAILSASPVNARRRAAGKLPANIILFRDGGHELPELPPFTERSGMTLSLYGQVPAERGLCMRFGAKFVKSQPAEGQTDADFYRALAAQIPSDESQLVLVHLKGADEHGHDDEPDQKAAALEQIDECFVGELAARLRADDVLVVTGDHTTPCELGIHSSDPVPTLVHGGSIAPDASARFSEHEAAAGALPVTRAPDLLAYLGAAVGIGA
jgi:2,3-bisphosphoglycerate-independent phosphoglycerate mutase